MLGGKNCSHVKNGRSNSSPDRTDGGFGLVQSVSDGASSGSAESDIPWRFQVKRTIAVLAVALAFATVAANAADSKSINGWISDSMCGAKHAGSGAACVKKCIEGGTAPVFVDEGKKEVWTIDNPDSVKSFYGDHVTVKATADSDKKSVHIDSIEAAK
jgi:hypothetical protein